MTRSNGLRRQKRPLRLEEISDIQPTLVAPEPHEILQLYISATSIVVSIAIVIERGESETNRKVQYLVYFISEVLSDSKTRYFHIMKLAHALLITSRKLSHYFQVH
jgi:hypothetical protein